MNIYIIGFFVLALIAGNVFGTLQIAADKSNVMIGESVTLTCTDTTKQDVTFFFEKNNTLGECVTAPPGCTPSDASLYTLSMDSSNAAFNLYKLTIKKFTSSMCGLYLCREQVSSVASNEVKLGSTAKLSARINLKTESLELETLNCFDQTEAPKIKVSWECQKPDGDWKEIEFKSVDFVPSGSCNPTACDLISYKKLKKVATVEPCTECNITLRATLSFDSIQPESVEISGAPIRGPIACTAEPTTTIPTSTTTATTTTSATTDVQTTASTPTTATLTVTLPTTSAPTTATSTVTPPTTATSIVTAPTTSAPTTATQTVTAPTTSPIISSNSSTTSQSWNNNMHKVGYIIGGCIGGAIVVALLIVIPLCVLRGPMCKGWRSKKRYETSKDPGAKHSSARHHRHGGNSHTRKQYERPQKSHTPDQSFPNHYNKHAYVGPASRSSGHHVNVSKPPSYSFYDPYSGEYVRTAGQRGGHPIDQRYAPFPQSQHRGRMQQTWYQPYTPGRPGFNDNSGNWDFYY